MTQIPMRKISPALAIKYLKELYKEVDSCRFCKRSQNTLQHILGFGAMNSNFMLVLINPTYRNISSNPEYKGPRFPFIGSKTVLESTWKCRINK